MKMPNVDADKNGPRDLYIGTCFYVMIALLGDDLRHAKIRNVAILNEVKELQRIIKLSTDRHTDIAELDRKM